MSLSNLPIVGAVLRSATVVALLMGQAPGGAPGQAKDGKKGPAAPQALTVSTLKPGLFLIVGDGWNTSVRVTKDGIIVTDTKNLGYAR